MGSKLRKLRVKAGVAGSPYQSSDRLRAQRHERARRRAEEQGSKVAASSKHPGPVLPEPFMAKEFTNIDESRWEPKLTPHNGIEQPCAATATGNSEPAAGVSVGPALSGNSDTRPPAAGMRIARRMPLLAQVALMSMMLAGVEPPKGDR